LFWSYLVNIIRFVSITLPSAINAATSIGFYLPTIIAAASIYVYDMNGGQLKSISIPQREKGIVTIKGSELSAGMYLYVLKGFGMF
jgi:hypothetical protein